MIAFTKDQLELLKQNRAMQGLADLVRDLFDTIADRDARIEELTVTVRHYEKRGDDFRAAAGE